MESHMGNPLDAHYMGVGGGIGVSSAIPGGIDRVSSRLEMGA